MERIASIVLLGIVLAGTGYLYMENVDRMDAATIAAAELEAEAAEQAVTDSIYDSKTHFKIPHDKDETTTDITVTMDGSGSFDANGDSLSYTWSLLSGDAVLSSDSTDGTTFTAASGEYTLKLTVTDNYGASTSDEKTVTVEAEPNDAPEVQIVASDD
jgi:type II secretory pathway pseudopilin PulG